MAKVYPEINQDLKGWIEKQQMFFVASAPLSQDGHINCSPKGSDSFRIIDSTTVAYQDLTGSGIETIAHIQENGRILIMFCAFEGAPRIVRLHGHGSPIFPDSGEYQELYPLFTENMGTRAIIKIKLHRIATSCGYSVPLYDFVGQRDGLDKWVDKQGLEGVMEYRANNNRLSIDGLKGLEKFN